MGSLPHLYSPANPITDSDIDRLLAIESEDCTSWKRVKKSRELEIYSRKGTQRGSPPVTKVCKRGRVASKDKGDTKIVDYYKHLTLPFIHCIWSLQQVS